MDGHESNGFAPVLYNVVLVGFPLLILPDSTDMTFP
jgi:hypothetical protein